MGLHLCLLPLLLRGRPASAIAAVGPFFVQLEVRTLDHIIVAGAATTTVAECGLI
jgi:hypothetical protein